MKVKKILCSILAGVIAVSTFSISAFAEEEKQMSVTVRIEGINENLYYNTLDIPYTSENLTVQNALMYVDEQSDDITITGADIGWITAVNDDKQGTFGGWDGWLYTVNGISPYDTVDTYKLSDGDNIVLYYGDPYGVGMQYPEVDDSKIDDGILTFVSHDTIYDADYNPTVVTNPVADANIEFGIDDNETIMLTTDKNGSVTIDKRHLTAGNHFIAIKKESENGIPLVLRFAPDFTIAIPVKSDESSKPENSEPSEESSEPTIEIESTPEESKESSVNEPTNITSTETSNGKTPSTGDSSALTVIVLTAATAFAVILMTRKKNNEK